jgi:hypothetical protein
MKAAGHGRFHVARCSPDRHRGRRGGAPPWSHQYDARGLGQHIAKTHAASRAAAIHRHRCYHAHGLDHGEITDKERGLVVLNEIYTRTGDDSTTPLGTGKRRNTMCGSPPMHARRGQCCDRGRAAAGSIAKVAKVTRDVCR